MVPATEPVSAQTPAGLAGRGWRVTGVDISTTAFQRAAAQADRLGLDVTWQHLDLSREPAPGTYDLVTAYYLHLPVTQRRTLFTHLAAASPRAAHCWS